jgi:UDP-N-acetyl-D-glucosamine dehydrogenase
MFSLFQTGSKPKPFGFMPFYPGPGLGGHCIPIDPFYLSWKALEVGLHTRFIELAGEINSQTAEYVVCRVTDCLIEAQKAVRGSRVLIIGLAYKADVDDERESSSYRLMALLNEAGTQVDYYDPYIKVVPPTRQYGYWEGRSSVEWTERSISGFDVVLIATAHRNINYHELADWAQCIVDTRNVMAGISTTATKVYKA